MTYVDRLNVAEAAAIVGADQLDDAELAGQLAEMIDELASDRGNAHSMIQDLRELAAVALVTARRLEAKQ